MITEQSIRQQTVEQVAAKMMAAARTAPKAKGLDTLEILVATKTDIETIAAKMKEMGTSMNLPGFVRDAGNILKAEAMVIIGTRIKSIGLTYCGLCGFKNCTEKQNHPEHPCAFNTGDMGIAVGSAVSVAMDARIDNRIMYSVGMAIRELGILDEDVKIIYGIPLSCTSKNVFFDRG
jgi:uncharacterized ferredoxin-like protein